MDANELGRWTRFAAKGGIGKCVAVQDCIAEEDEDLMFLRDDEIVVLMQLTAHEDLYLGYCEGVVGRFNASNVRFLSRLKRPVMTKRNSRSLSRSSSRPPSAQGRESLSALAHRDSPSLPHATRRTSPSHPVAAAPAAETSNLMSSALPSASLPSSPHSQLDHLRCVSHSSTSTTVDSTPRTPAEFQIEQSTTGPVRIVDIPTQDDDSVYEHKQSEAEENALLYTDDLIDDDPSYTDSEPSTHISFDVSEGTSAIGLSLLRDFVNGEVDDGMSVHSLSGSVSTVDERVSSGIVAQVTDRSPRSSVYSLGSTRNESRGRQSPSRTSQQPSNVSSDYGSDEWDGASDIYDNYRYSRASMASKMSRFSKGSLHTVASGLGLDAPPLPISDSHRPSLDSMRHGAGSARDRLGLITTASSSIEDVKQTVQPADSLAAETANPADIGTSSRHIPPPLDLTLSNHTRMPSSTTQSFPSSSPLLHSAFHSPLSSPDAQSPTYLSPTSTPSTAPLYSAVPGGAATALRQRLERSKGSVPATRAIESTFADLQPDLRGKARLSSQPIVVDDDEGQLDTSIDTAAQHSPSTSSTSFSAAEEKKKMIETTYIVVNQAPPPPYTLTPSTEASAADATTNVPIPRASVEQGAASSSSSRTSAFVRRSLFLPHPHAPKPAEVPNGPMYGRTPVVAGQSFSDGPPPGSVAHTLHLALSAFGDPFRPRIVTIYAQFDRDLATSVGPVPVSFSLVPQNNIPAHHPKPSAPVLQPEADALDGQQMSMSSNKPIPRPNFFPQTPSIRPRSRSFSDFDTSGHKGLATADQRA
ncbi:hypothetical protein BC835DRAFT_870883 [Cytidiella melzeri]|nr:hypothetical protein BC835DRAFT_870883 [Cytidiella melzeri]